MLPCRLTVALLALLAACVATAVSAETPVRVYTNADLVPVDAVSLEVSEAADESGWEFVAEFIAREHQRLDAERSHELDRRRVDIEENRRPRRGSDAYYGYPVGYAHPYSHGVRKPGHRPRATSGAGGRIVPLHARPTPAQVHRTRAIQRSGADAFPR
jgi:hypothetical protein